MQYLLALYVDEYGWGRMTTEQQQQGSAAYTAYTEALRSAGVLINSNRLRPSATATTLRSANGKTQVLDGPFAESKELVGGFFLLDCSTREQALGLAAECPAAEWATIEVREVGPCYE